MTQELLLRVIGYLFLLGAVLYLLYLFAPASVVNPLRAGLARFWTLGTNVRTRPVRRRSPSAADRGREMALAEGYDELHAERIATCARLLAEAIGLSPEVVAGLVEAAYLHDLGMADLAVALAKPAPLSPEERSHLRAHPIEGERLALDLAKHPDTPWWVRWHHERLDGSGYPDGLLGDEIPLPARILSIADAFEALTHRRPYRQALDAQDALAELRGLAGLHYDPWLIGVFTDQVFPRLVVAEDEAIAPLHDA